MIISADPRTHQSRLLNTATMNAHIARRHIPSSIKSNCLFGGRMGLFFGHFPLTEIPPHAEIAAESAEVAGAAGLFWDMHDALFENQSSLSVPTIFLIGAQRGRPETAMRNALETGQFRMKVRGDFMSGIRRGVNGTPT